MSLLTAGTLALSLTAVLAWQSPPCCRQGAKSRPSFRGSAAAAHFFAADQRRPDATQRSRIPAAVCCNHAPLFHDAFVEKVLALTGDPLEQEGGRIVVFRGNPSAPLMLVGEAPGAEEDRLGVPFVGRSGQLLDDILRAVGLDPDHDVYISNIVRRRPINNRTPTPEEMEFYLPILLEEIGLVDPDVIVTLGASSTKALLPFETRGITKARGEWADPDALAQAHGGALSGRRVMPWFHPSYLIRNAGERSRREGGVRWHTRNDLREVKKALLPCRPSAPSSPGGVGVASRRDADATPVTRDDDDDYDDGGGGGDNYDG
eukprot:g5245.t1